MVKNRQFGFNHNSTFCFLFILFFGIMSCQKEDTLPVSKPANYDQLVQYLESTGFKGQDITLENGIFIIDNDILISKNEVEAYMKQNPVLTNGRVEHYRGYLVSNTYVTNIKIYIGSSVPSSWVTAIRGAIQQWNGVNGTKLAFSEVSTSSTANITVGTSYSSDNWVARAYLPSSNGRPGSSMTINTKYNSMDSGRKLFTFVHEIGHTFGLYHTDQTTGTFIQGTPSVDSKSVMNSYVLPWNGFTAGDVAAVQIIYPE